MTLRLLYAAAWLTAVPACPVTASSQDIPVPIDAAYSFPMQFLPSQNGKLNFLAVDTPKGSGRSGADEILTICMTE